jgi:Ni/Fe-hydrogenase subunit HybB-like protein
MSTEMTTAPIAGQPARAGLGFHFTWTKGRYALAAITALGFILGVIRFAIGLGPTTNLSDAWPWGLWIGFNVLSGVALSGGAFSMAALVYIFNVKRFHPISRASVLAGFLGYLTVVFSLLVELGQPHRVWHPWIMWQEHSVMFEVAWCVTLYLGVLALEFAPVYCERMGWKKWENLVHKALIPLVIAGIVLSTLHQSSLGTMFLIMPQKINALWYTPWLPVFAYMTSIGAGLATLTSFSI